MDDKETKAAKVDNKGIAWKWWRAAMAQYMKEQFEARVIGEREGKKNKDTSMPPVPSSTKALLDGVKENQILHEGFYVDPAGEEFYVLLLDLGLHGIPKFVGPVSVLEPKAKSIRTSG